jgi:glyoxylase-like metal-dependent hydrolase (beta-lactamase superfamily II)
VNDLPVAERWFRSRSVADGITLLVEDHLDPFFESNVWHVRGRDRDLVVDTGNGIGDLRAELAPSVGDRPVVAVATHDHFDHVGGMHAFDERWCHAADADGIRDPDGLALLRRDFRPGLEDEIRWFGYEPPEVVITALPTAGFDVAGWRTPVTEPTRVLSEGDVADLGDRAFQVLHVPGHTADPR